MNTEATPASNPAVMPRLGLLNLADIGPQTVGWLWEPYLPTGMLTLLSGDPGCGTTYLALAIAAAITRGFKVSEFQDCREHGDSEAFSRRGAEAPGEEDKVSTSHEERSPAGDGGPVPASRGRETGDGFSDVLYLGNENSAAYVLRPRFDALGGDPSRFHLLPLPAIPESRETRSGSGEGDAPASAAPALVGLLDEALQQTRARLVIVDPLQSSLGKCSQHSQRILDGLGHLAQKYDCCVLLIRHLSRSRTGRIRACNTGPLDLAGAVCSELLAGISPEDAAQRALVQVRSNLGPLGPALGYSIDHQGAFHWTGENDLEASALLAPDPTLAQRSALNVAVSYLREALATSAEQADSIMSGARMRGISETTLQRAKERLRIISRKRVNNWYWSLPDGEQIPDELRSWYRSLAERDALAKIKEQLSRTAAAAKDDNLDNLAARDNLDAPARLADQARARGIPPADIGNLTRVLKYIAFIKCNRDLLDLELRGRFEPINILKAWKTVQEISKDKASEVAKE
jgi:hypothetical protein